MACQVVITSVTASGPPLSAVTVTGTATVPDCMTVTVKVVCGGTPLSSLTVPVDAGGNWSATFTDFVGTKCVCGSEYVVTAKCDQSSICREGLASGNLDCMGQCPTAMVSVSIGDCQPDGTREVMLNATITPGSDPTIVTQWEVEAGVFASASASLSYGVTHYYDPGQAYVAVLHVVLPPGCPPIGSVAIGPLEPCPCPELAVNATVAGCADANTAATATFTATLTPPGSNCGSYHWTFGDGTTEITTTPTTTHLYQTSGTFAASAAIECGACLMTAATDVTVKACGGGGNKGGNGGEGGGCFAIRAIMVIAAILAIAASALALCLPPPAAAILGWIALGLGIVAAALAILWAIFCPKPCAWALLFAWQVLVGVGFVLLAFTVCCPTFWWIGFGLLAIGLTLMFLWRSHCKVSNCELWKELSITISGVIIPLLADLAHIPVLAACTNGIVTLILSGIAVALVIAVANCVHSQSSSN